MNRWRWVAWLLSAVATAPGCREVPQAPPEPQPPAEPVFRVFRIDSQYNVDYGPGFRYPGLLVTDGTTVSLVYNNFEAALLRYAGCPINCDHREYWRMGTVDRGGNGVDIADHVGAAASATGLHSLHQRNRFATGGELVYGFCPGLCDRATSWRQAVIDSTGDTGYYVSLTSDAAGRLHASYVAYDVNRTNPRLLYATCATQCDTPGNWQRGTVDSTGIDERTTIATDLSGRVHLAYFRLSLSQPPGISYATCAGGCTDPSAWTTTSMNSVDAWFDQYTGPQLAVAPDGRLAIAFWRADTLKLASCAGGCDAAGAWEISRAASLPPRGSDLPASSGGVGLAIDLLGTWHLAYGFWLYLPGAIAGTVDIVGIVRHSACDANCGNPVSWRTATVDSTEYLFPQVVTVAADADGRPSVAFTSFGALFFAQGR